MAPCISNPSCPVFNIRQKPSRNIIQLHWPPDIVLSKHNNFTYIIPQGSDHKIMPVASHLQFLTGRHEPYKSKAQARHPGASAFLSIKYRASEPDTRSCKYPSVDGAGFESHFPQSHHSVPMSTQIPCNSPQYPKGQTRLPSASTVSLIMNNITKKSTQG